MKWYPRFITSNLLSFFMGASVSMMVNVLPDVLCGNPYMCLLFISLLLQVLFIYQILLVRETIDCRFKSYEEDQLARGIVHDVLISVKKNNEHQNDIFFLTSSELWKKCCGEFLGKKWKVYAFLVLILMSVIASVVFVKKGVDYNGQMRVRAEAVNSQTLIKIVDGVSKVQAEIKAVDVRNEQLHRMLIDSIARQEYGLLELNERIRRLEWKLRKEPK